VENIDHGLQDTSKGQKKPTHKNGEKVNRKQRELFVGMWENFIEGK